MSSKSTPKTFVFSTAGDDTTYTRGLAKKRARIDDAIKRYFECDWSQLPPMSCNPYKGSTPASASASEFWPLNQDVFCEKELDIKIRLRMDADLAQNDELARKRSVLERRLADAERHVSEEPTNASAWLARLSAAEEVLERAQVQQLWQSALQEMTKLDAIGLCWAKYIRFLCRSFDTFSVRRLEDDVAEGLKALYALLATIDNNQLRLADIETSIVILIWMLAFELARAGFAERGLAILQATFELAVNNAITQHTWPKLLEDFWGSEFVRLGDSAVSGMSRWYAETRGMRVAPASSVSEEPASARLYHVGALPISVAELKYTGDASRRATDPGDPPALSDAEDPRTSSAPSEDAKNGIVVDDETEALLMKFDGSIRSLQNDGTVYSLKHGYRIDIRETDAASIYDRIKSKLTRASAQAASTPSRIINRHAASSEAKPGMEETASLDESVASALTAWAHSEEVLDSAQWAPVYSRQAPDVKTCEPERIVGFAEVSRFVYPLWSVASKRYLLLRILKFVGLCCPRSGSFAMSEQLSSPANMGLGDDDMSSPSELTTLADPTLVLSPGLQNSQSAQAFVRNLLAYSARHPALGSIHPEEKSLQGTIWGTQLTSAILRFDGLVVTAQRRADRLSEDDFRLHRNNLISTLRQTSRDAPSLELWRAYIDFECLADNRVEALRVCYATISMSQSLAVADPSSLSELYWTCTRIHLYSLLLSPDTRQLLETHSAKVLHVLACFADDEHSKMTPTFLHAACAPSEERIEAIRNRFSLLLATAVTRSKEKLAALDLTMSMDDTLLLVPVTACFAWFEFLAKNVVSGLSVFDQGLGHVKHLIDKNAGCSEINLNIAVLEVSRGRLEALRKEMVCATSKKHSIWFRTTIINPNRERRAAVARKKTKVQYSRLVHSHPGSKQHWLLAFREPILLRSFDASELADILNQLLERGIRLRDPRIVAYLH